MNNIFSGKKYHASPGGVSLMDEMNNIFQKKNIAHEIQILEATGGFNIRPGPG